MLCTSQTLGKQFGCPLTIKQTRPRFARQVATVTKALWGRNPKDNQFISNQGQQQQQKSYYPPVYQSPDQIQNINDLDQVSREKLKLGTALRNIGWLSFWSQLILSTVSGVILLFSVGITSNGAVNVSPLDACTLVGVVCGLISSFLAWTWINTGRRLGMLQDVKLQRCLVTVLASNKVNLVGMGASILGLQATVGQLVGKTLTSAANAYGPRAGAPPVAFDIFSVQACANTIMAHFAGMLLANWLLGTLTKVLSRAEDGYEPSAPPAPASGFF